MSFVSLLDLAAATASLAALLFILFASRRTTWKPEVILFTFIIILTLSHDVGNFLEWAGYTSWFDPVEDFLEVLTAALWAFFFYTFLQELTELKLRQLQALDEKILDGSPVAFVLRDSDLRVLKVSKAFKRVTGYDPALVIGKSTEEFMPDMPGRQELEARHQKVLASGEQLGPTEMQAPSPVPRYLREKIFPVKDTKGNVTNTLSVLEDITDQKYAWDALEESESRYKMLFDSIHDGVVVHEIEKDGRPGRFLEVNLTFCQMTGYSRKELLGITPLDLSEMVRYEAGSMRKTLLAGGSTSFERTIFSKTGAAIPCEMRAHSFQMGDKQVILSVVRDITERKRAHDRISSSLAEKETLLREIHHRVKNNLQVISGLLNLQAHYIDDEGVRNIYKESQNRIKTMALIHEELYQREDLARINLAEYISGLAGNLMASYSMAVERISLDLDLEDAEITIDTAIPCGLIVNEIVSNSLAHAFPDNAEGKIKIKLKLLEGEKYELTISDDGTGLPAELEISKTKTLGLRLVSILSEQLGADLQMDINQGTEFTLTFQEYQEAGSEMY